MDKKKAEPPKLIELTWARCKARNYSDATFKSYWHWFRRFLLHHKQLDGGKWVDPKLMGRVEIQDYLTHLATVEDVAATTQNLAFNAILFVYKEVLGIKIENIDSLRAKRPQRVRDVLSADEAGELLKHLSGQACLMAMLQLGCGHRVAEVCNMRIKDVDFGNGKILIRDGKGHKDRIVQLPDSARERLKLQIAETERLHAMDVQDGCARVPLPGALERKCPRAASEIGWYYLFSSKSRSKEPGTGRIGRFHVDLTTYTRKLAESVRRAGIKKRTTSHVLRHTYASLIYKRDRDPMALMVLLGHESLETTMRYIHELDDKWLDATPSPLDSLLRIA